MDCRQLRGLHATGTAEACKAGSDGSREAVGWARLGEPREVGRIHHRADRNHDTKRSRSLLEDQAEPESPEGSSCDQEVGSS